MCGSKPNPDSVTYNLYKALQKLSCRALYISKCHETNSNYVFVYIISIPSLYEKKIKGCQKYQRLLCLI